MRDRARLVVDRNGGGTRPGKIGQRHTASRSRQRTAHFRLRVSCRGHIGRREHRHRPVGGQLKFTRFFAIRYCKACHAHWGCLRVTSPPSMQLLNQMMVLQPVSGQEQNDTLIRLNRTRRDHPAQRGHRRR